MRGYHDVQSETLERCQRARARFGMRGTYRLRRLYACYRHVGTAGGKPRYKPLLR